MQSKKSRINKHDLSGRQTNSSDLVDRISHLPDSILGVILSFLLTKEAVATSVLSKRWKFAWVSVHNLDFDFGFGSGKAKKKGADMKFIEFVRHVLHLHSSRLLNKFRFVWNPDLISSSYSNAWINTTIKKKVCELSLRCVGPYDFPINVFSCDSLHSLELIGGITSIYDEIVICLPRLTSLKISPVSFGSKKACEMLLSGCPLLNYLHLNIGNDEFECIISSASLRRLEISFKGKCSLKLKAYSLEYLMLDGCISDIFVDKSLASLVQADFNIELDEDDFPINSIVEVVRACHCAKVITLSFDVIWALSRATISLSTQFKRLVKLVAGTCSSLQEIIHNSENLEVLIIDKDLDHLYESYFNDHSKWSTVGEVPSCLANSLKKVQLDNYTGSKDEREMIQFMLKNGSVLEVMEISCYINEESYRDSGVLQRNFELLQMICEFPRKSPACEVRFSG